MNTKLVYVLTCDENNYYAEQALMSIFTAKYYNPEAKVSLIVDDLTNNQFFCSGNELLSLVDEKIVINLEEKLSMKERSRWLKTSVRNIIDGDYLFIDCDTLIQKPLNEVDQFVNEIGAVPDEHIAMKNYIDSLYDENVMYAKKLDWDITAEEYYYNSGVMFVKDTPNVREFYSSWHCNWKNGLIKGLSIDQPSLAKTNYHFNNLITKLDGVWNCIIFVGPPFLNEAKILHFWSYRNISFLYEKEFLKYVRLHGIDNFVKYFILHPLSTMVPFDSSLKNNINSFFNNIFNISNSQKQYKNKIGFIYEGFNSGNIKVDSLVKFLFKYNQFLIGSTIIILYKYFKRKKTAINPCAKEGTKQYEF